MSDENVQKRKRNSRDDEIEKEKYKRSKKARSKSRSPTDSRYKDPRSRRKRCRSRSPEQPKKTDKDTSTAEVKKEPPERKNKETDMLNTRTGGAYIPPARLRMMQAQITDKSSVAFQRLAWEALKKSIHGHINKINVGNIGIIIRELLKENIVRGRGLLCRSVIQAQAASPTFTNVYAALVAAVNSRFPNIGELLLKRLVIQFKRGFKRNDKPTCISSALFIAHLVNQRVAHEILALELLTLLVETPTDDSVEVSIAFLKECGQKLTEVSSKGVNAIFEMLRNILHEGQLDKRVQYMIEVMFQVWKDGFKDHPAVIEELELVPEEDQFTHLLMLDDATDAQDILNVFKFDDKYEENEQTYKALSKEILGSDVESGDEEGSDPGESGSEESEDEDEENDEAKPVTIIDNTETNLVALRRTIYLTINSSLDFEECAHKLMKMQLKPGQEVELCHMFLDCCAEQRTYEKFYGLLAQRFCNLNRIYIDPFEQIFKDSYGTAHRLDTNRLRNVSKFFAHLLFTDSISWEALECVKLTEDDTTSSSRIFIKILFQELAEYMGLKKLNDRLKDPTLQEAFSGVFPRDNPKNTRFSINFFTSIGLGGLTDELREHLKQMPKIAPPPAEIRVGSSSSESSSSSDSSSSEDSSSDSDDDERSNNKNKKNYAKNSSPGIEEQSDKNNAERWGHDGFYDTYGKDARRHERNERDGDGFFKPRDPKNKRRNTDREIDDYRRRDKEFRNREGDRYDRERNERETNRRIDHEEVGRFKDKGKRDGGKRERDEDSGYDSRREKEKSRKDKLVEEKRDQGSRDRASSPAKNVFDDEDKGSRRKHQEEKSRYDERDRKRESSIRRSESRSKEEVTRYWDSKNYDKGRSTKDNDKSKEKRKGRDDGWDIRGSSIRRSESRTKEEETRYWDSYDSSEKKRAEKSERRRERS